MLAIEILKSMKEFRVDDELPFNTVDYLNIDTAIEELAALEAVAEAARAVVFEYWESPESTPSKANIAMKDLVDKVAALKGAE